MYCAVQDLIKFYDSEIGSIVRQNIGECLADLWPDLHGYRVLGCGYTTPYFDFLDDRAERMVAMMPQKQGAHNWPVDEKNRVMLTKEERLPLESCSVDRAILVHYLEYCDHQEQAMQEIWRVLKPNGRLIVVAANRMGAWSHAEWSPFGYGRPFSVSQLNAALKSTMFIHEVQKSAVFIPPLPDSPVVMRFANLIEKLGQSALPFVAGVHIVEASKKIYANAEPPGPGTAVLEKTKKLLGGAKPSAAPQGFTVNKRR